MLRRLLVCVAVLGALVSVTSLEAQRPRGRAATPTTEAHTVVLHRAYVVGARLRVEREGEKHMRLERQSGRAWEVVRAEDTFVTFHAEQRVLAVNAAGKITSADYVIERLEIRQGETRTTPIARGAVLHSERPEGARRPVFSTNGQPVAEPLAEALSVVISGDASEVTDDQIFGSTTPRRVGERWPIDDAVAERDASRAAGIDVDLGGSVTLVEATTVNEVPCLIFEGAMTGRLRAMPNMPPDARLDSGSLAVTQRGAFPTDVALQPTTSDFSLTLDATFRVTPPTGPALRFRMQVRETRRETTRALR